MARADDDGPEQTSAREARQIDRLADFLAYPRWRSDQAAWIMAGIDPEMTMGGPGDWGFAWLPGGLRGGWRTADGGADPWILERHVMMELEEVRGFVRGASRTPAEWIKLARSLGYEPSWLNAAIKHSLLPQASCADHHSTQAKGGISTRNGSAPHKAKRQLVAAWDALVAACAIRGARLIDEEVRSFEEEMIRSFCNGNASLTAESSIRRWVRGLKQEHRGGSTPEWASEIRESSAREKLA